MKKLLFTIAFLVSLYGYADAAKFWPVPECPEPTHETCNNGKDDDLNGLKDGEETPVIPCIAAVTGGYAANLATCQLLTYTSTADAESESGNSAQKTTKFSVGQIAATGDFATGTYFMWVRARIAPATAAPARAVWTHTSAFARTFDNSRAGLLFPVTNGVSSTMAWSKVGEGLNFAGILNASAVNPNTVTHKSVSFDGDSTIYLVADGAVKFDCIFFSTTPDATPICEEPAAPVPQAGAITVSGVTTTGFTATWDYDTATADNETNGCILSIGTTAGNLTPGTPFNTTSGNCVAIETGKDPGTIYFIRGNSSNENGSTDTPQTSVQTSVQTTGPIRFAVASGGSAVATCLSAGTPCTLARALNQAVAGDTVQLANGTYTTVLASVRAGTASQPITVTAENRHLAIIQPATSAQCVRVTHSNIIIKRLTISGNNSANCTDGVQLLGAKGPPEVFLTGLIIEDNQIINIAGKGLFAGAVDGAIIRWNTINTTGLTIYNSSAGMYFGSFDGTSQAKNLQVYANTIIDSMTEGFDIKVASNNNDIHHNIVEFSGRNSNNGIAAVCSPTGTCDNPNTGGVTFDGWARVTDNIFRSWEVRSYGGCASTFNTSGNALFERNVCRTATTGVALGGNASGVATARSNTFCGLSSYATNGGGSTWTLVTNNGVPGSGAASSACDSEEARILAEMAALPGNPDGSGGGGPGEPGSGPIGYWPFNENTGTVAADSIGSNDANLINGATWTTGKNGSALSLAGTNDHAKILTTDMSTTEGTVTLWVKPSSFPSGNRYFFGHTSQPAFGSRIQLYHDDTGGNLDFGFGDSHSKATGLLDMTAGTWYHLAITWNNGSYVVYVNGASVSSGSYTGFTALGSYLHIGKNGSDGPSPEGCACAIDEVKIWNRQLSGAEVDAEYDLFA